MTSDNFITGLGLASLAGIAAYIVYLAVDGRLVEVAARVASLF